MTDQSKKIQKAPEPSIRRLSLYLTYLKNVDISKKDYISAPTIAKDLNLDPTQVTKDIAYTGIEGKTKIGYKTEELKKYIEEFLGYGRTDIAFLVGAGNLGKAVISYDGFKQAGLKIVAAFDEDATKIGGKVDEIEIFDVKKLGNLIERLHVQIGIITTPAYVAQEICDIMTNAGIKAIWNFSQAILKTSEDIIVVNTSLYNDLAILMSKINKK